LGYGVIFAGFLAGIFMVGSLFLSPVVGYLVDRIGREEFFIAGGSLLLAILFLLVPAMIVGPLPMVLSIGIAAAFIPVPVYSLVPRLLPANRTGMGYGVISTCLNVGGLLGPFLVGMSYDKSGSYTNGFRLMAAFTLTTVAVAVRLRVLTEGRRLNVLR